MRCVGMQSWFACAHTAAAPACTCAPRCTRMHGLLSLARAPREGGRDNGAGQEGTGGPKEVV